MPVRISIWSAFLSGAGSPTPWSGVVSGGSEIFFIQPDHLNTPRVVVNAQSRAIWRWDSSPFGDSDANEQPTIGIASFAFNLRFPGQQYDRETAAHYNYFRDYETVSGRYLQSDPVGIWGGIDNFSFAGNAPVKYFDNFGLRLTVTSKGTGKRKDVPGVPNPCGTGSASSKGKNGEAAAAAFAASQGYIVTKGSKISVPGGSPVIPDFIAEDPLTGDRFLLDAKCGPCAGLTKNQRKGYKTLATGGVFKDVLILKFR